MSRLFFLLWQVKLPAKLLYCKRKRDRPKYWTFRKKGQSLEVPGTLLGSVSILPSSYQLCKQNLSLPFIRISSFSLPVRKCVRKPYSWGWKLEACLRIHKLLKWNVNRLFSQTRTMAVSGWVFLLAALLSMAFAVAHSEYSSLFPVLYRLRTAHATENNF